MHVGDRNIFLTEEFSNEVRTMHSAFPVTITIRLTRTLFPSECSAAQLRVKTRDCE